MWRRGRNNPDQDTFDYNESSNNRKASFQDFKNSLISEKHKEGGQHHHHQQQEVGEDTSQYAQLSTGDVTTEFPDHLDVASPTPQVATYKDDVEDDDNDRLNQKFNSDNDINGENDIEDDEDEEEEEIEDENRLKPGDHIFVWQTFGVPYAYQKHAIVLSVTPRELKEDDNNDGDDDTEYDLDNIGTFEPPPEKPQVPEEDVMVVSFYHKKRENPGERRGWSLPGSQRWRQNRAAAAAMAQAEREEEERRAGESLLHEDGEINTGDDATGRSTSAINTNTQGRTADENESTTVKIRQESLQSFAQNAKVRKVKYSSSRLRRLLGRAGTVTLIKADDNEVVTARARYLLSHPEALPEYHAMAANAESASVWCRTGRWCTLQGASILEITALGQAGSAAVAGGIVSQLWVLVPAPGLWGAYGWFWYVPATVAYPFLVPLLVTFGLASLVPIQVLRKYRQKWKKISDGMNRDFWLQADGEFKNKHFGNTVSSDEGQMRTFFGMRDQEEEMDEDRGLYMPVGGGVDEDDGEDNEEESEEYIMARHEQNMAANYEADASGAFGRRPDQQQGRWPFQRQMSNLVQRWAKPQQDGGGAGSARFGGLAGLGGSSRQNITLESTEELMQENDCEPMVSRNDVDVGEDLLS